jgi:superfamily I DNA/RNA helicase
MRIRPAFSHTSNLQLDIISYVSGEAPSDSLVIAGPGSGKTRTLVGAISALVKKDSKLADKLVAISFTNNSAAELKVRLAHQAKQYDLPALHRIHVSTFHGWVGQLQARHIVPWSYPPIGLKSASLAVALDLKSLDATEHHFSKAEISAADRHMEGCETFAAMEARKFNRIGEPGSDGDNRIGFDLLKLAVEELESSMAECQIGTFGTQMKAGASLAGHLKPGDIDWLFIDEAQDMNATQADFVRAVQEATKCRVFVIADDDQGIYKFRGASNAFLRDFGAKATTRTFELTQNFRSTQQIVKLCVNWIRPNWEELQMKEKSLLSKRTGLPVVVLTHPDPRDRGRHAKTIIEACKKVDLLKSYGEAAILGLSAAANDWEIEESGLDVHAISDQGLPQEILDAWIEMLSESRATGKWHHTLWQEFLDEVTSDQQASGDPQLGYPGLNDLYAALEVCRRLHPEYSPSYVANVLKQTTCGFTDEGKASNGACYAFLGSRPDPGYAGDKVNYISFHSSKGMEFPVVWVTGAPFTFAPKDPDKSEGQPNLLGELGEYALKKGKAVMRWVDGKTEIDEEKLNEIAERMESRRLLYVAMSRASDLLMISAPSQLPNARNKKQQEDNERRRIFIEALKVAFATDVEYRLIRDDADAKQFASSILAEHRNPDWQPPKRYRVESYTSHTGQILPGEVREVEIPKNREYPRSQSESAMVGDQFHRIMHLLCLEPDLLREYLTCNNHSQVVARVVVGDSPVRLVELVEKYFSDITNKPYELLQSGKCRSEVPFSVVEEEITDPPTNPPNEYLVKGFIDLVRFNDRGEPELILDYKIGKRPTDSDINANHKEQLAFYRKSLATIYSVPQSSISMVNYYVADQQWIERK